MKLTLLPNNPNRELIKELLLSYISEAYAIQVKRLIVTIKKTSTKDITLKPNETQYKDFSLLVLLTINKILLDNMTLHVAEKTVSNYMTLIKNKTVDSGLYINPFYVNELIDETNRCFCVSIEKSIELNHEITKALHRIISTIYQNNSDRYNAVLFNTFNEIHLLLCNFNFRYFKYMLDEYYRPLLLYAD